MILLIEQFFILQTPKSVQYRSNTEYVAYINTTDFTLLNTFLFSNTNIDGVRGRVGLSNCLFSCPVHNINWNIMSNGFN